MIAAALPEKSVPTEGLNCKKRQSILLCLFLHHREGNMMKKLTCKCYGEEFAANLYEIVVKQLTGFPYLFFSKNNGYLQYR
jgi:hypothetical protein